MLVVLIVCAGHGRQSKGNAKGKLVLMFRLRQWEANFLLTIGRALMKDELAEMVDFCYINTYLGPLA